MTETAKNIRDLAADGIRDGGYRAFSFREIANSLGIKSSSVHYHYPSKESLALAVARDYSADFMSALGDPWNGEPVELLAGYVAAFRDAIQRDGRMCLCGILGSEIRTLPNSVALEARAFFQRNIDWLTIVYGRLEKPSSDESKAAKAARLLALLQGALLVSQVLDNQGLYDDITARIPR